jgi:hypothetical protein
MTTAINVPEGKFEWLVILPDREGALAKRVEVRPFVSLIEFIYSLAFEFRTEA